jgi:hypothetical protein
LDKPKPTPTPYHNVRDEKGRFTSTIKKNTSVLDALKSIFKK